MKKLVLLVLALVLLVPSPARATPWYYVQLNATCQEDADRHGVYVIQATFDMWTDRERLTRMIVTYEEYRDYGDDQWVLYRSTRDIARRSTGEVVDGWFHHSASYDVSFDPTSYDVKLDHSIWWKGSGISHAQYGTVAKKRDGGPCFAKSYGEPPPRT